VVVGCSDVDGVVDVVVVLVFEDGVVVNTAVTFRSTNADLLFSITGRFKDAEQK
jgi:hypothetical protein